MNDIERRLRDLGDRTAQEVTYREVPRGRIVRRARVRRGLIVAGPVAAVVLFAAVAYPRLGSDAERRGAVPVSVDLAAAAEATEREGSARIEMAMTMEFDGQSMTSEISGEIDFDDRRSYAHMTGMGAFSPVDGIEVISIGDVMYQREDGAAKWVKTRIDASSGSSMWGTGPTELFTYLESVSEDVTSFGEEVLDGVPVTHLRATVDPSKLAGMSEDRGMRLEPIHVWIDDADRVRKLSYAVTTDGPEGQSASTTVTMYFFDFGLPVDVQAPPREDVTTEPSPTWGGPGGDLVGSESSGSAALGETTMIMGERDIDEPYVEVDSHDGSFTEACVYSVRPVSAAKLVNARSGRGALVFEPVRSDGRFEGPTPVACVEERIRGAVVTALVYDPRQFRLRVSRPDGSSETVRLTQIASSPPGDAAEE